MRNLIGEIKSVHCLESNSIKKKIEGTAVVNVKYENGAVGTFSISDTTLAPWSWELTS